MHDTITLPMGQLQRLLLIVDMVSRLRSAQDRVLRSDSTDEVLAAVRDEASALRALDRALPGALESRMLLADRREIGPVASHRGGVGLGGMLPAAPWRHEPT